MNRIIVGTAWLAAAAAAAVAVGSAVSPADPSAGGDPVRAAETAGQVRRLATLEQRDADLRRREEEERGRRERIRTGSAPAPSPISSALRNADADVDLITAMTDLDEDIRHALVIVRYRGIEQLGVREWILREQVPGIKDRIAAMGVDEAAADAAARSLTDLLVARNNRQLDVFVEVAATDAKEGGLVAAHHRVESEFIDSTRRQGRERLEAALGPEQGRRVADSLLGGQSAFEAAPSETFYYALRLIDDDSARQALERRFNEEFLRLAEAGQASIGGRGEHCLLTAESEGALRGLLNTARAYVPAGDAEFFDHHVNETLARGLAATRALEQMVRGLRRLPRK